MVKLSIIIAGYNMQRELPRTVFSTLPPYQKDCNELDIEIVVVDNGSDIPFSRSMLKGFVPDDAPVSILNFPSGNPSPVASINHAVSECRGDLIGIMIDGARILSPGVLRMTYHSILAFAHPFVYTISAHLGHETQQVSTINGYNQSFEDELLDRIKWRENGYRLFGESVPAPSSQFGWFGPVAESNAFFMWKSDFLSLGQLNDKFTKAGGGLANLDFFRCAMESKSIQPVCLIGESSFHQVHGGITTNHSPHVSREITMNEFFQEYEVIRDKKFQINERAPVLLGTCCTESAIFSRLFKSFTSAHS
jgi:glycosyltransferase involved in cell wall biosynthesis